MLIQYFYFISQESIPSRELEPPLPAEPEVTTTAKATDPKVPAEPRLDVGPSSSVAPPQAKQGSSEDEFEALRKRLDALRK